MQFWPGGVLYKVETRILRAVQSDPALLLSKVKSGSLPGQASGLFVKSPGCFSEGSTVASIPRVLLIDDDPLQLDIYGKIVQKAGFESVPVLVRFSGPDPIPDGRIDLVLLDYRLNSVKTAPEIAQDIRAKFPQVPVILLTDLWSAPPDVAPFISITVRKGEPAKLFDALRSHLPNN